MTTSDPGFFGRPVTAGGLGCTRCPQGASSSPGSLVASSCFCAFGYTAVSPQTSNSSLTCLLSFSTTDSLSRFVDLGNPGESCDQVCAATGRKCQPELLDGLRDQSDVRQALTAVDVSLESAFSPSASLTDLFTGLHAHYKTSSWDTTAGTWQDVSGNARHGVTKYEAQSKECTVGIYNWDGAYSPVCEVIFSSLPSGWTPVVTISILAPNFNPPDKYVSKVIVGDKTVATGLLKYKRSGVAMSWDESCDQQSWAKILDDETAPVVVNKSGELVVRIETSPGTYSPFGCKKEYNLYFHLYARVSIHFTDADAKRFTEPVKILPGTNSSGNSTTSRFAAVAGADYSRVEFPNETIPSVFTICSTSRYSHVCATGSRFSQKKYISDIFHRHFFISIPPHVLSGCFQIIFDPYSTLLLH